MALNDFENGIRSYQDALQIDARHYNAWQGVSYLATQSKIELELEQNGVASMRLLENKRSRLGEKNTFRMKKFSDQQPVLHPASAPPMLIRPDLKKAKHNEKEKWGNRLDP
ncbi:hypothetical protein L6452_38841 [Arctium lappa]|uniref:Uncharacterized protein n=1 Tax=Arctium lappa TaxID=4217 RepID=A0ACB8XRU2_ARCLA|nr:hypothetical protein L6452_38841 [Arctium lappa]